MTYVHAEIDGDTFFPKLNPEDWFELDRRNSPPDRRTSIPCLSSPYADAAAVGPEASTNGPWVPKPPPFLTTRPKQYRDQHSRPRQRAKGLHEL